VWRSTFPPGRFTIQTSLPDLPDDRSRVEWQLHVAVVGEGGVGDLDQQHVFGTRNESL
jgi:hypothetical protein